MQIKPHKFKIGDIVRVSDDMDAYNGKVKGQVGYICEYDPKLMYYVVKFSDKFQYTGTRTEFYFLDYELTYLGIYNKEKPNSLDLANI